MPDISDQPRRVLIIEPNLRNPSGHYGEFVRAVGIRSEGVSIEVLAHPEADTMLRSMQGVHPSTLEPRVGDFLAEWRNIFNAVRDKTPFLVLTSDGRHAAAVSLAAACTGQMPDRATLYFHWIPKGRQDAILHALATHARQHARAVVPTEAIAEALRNMGWRRVECVPYPMFGPTEAPVPEPFARVLVAGAARLNKGLDLISALAEQWAKEDRSIPLFVQVSKKHAAKHGHREEGLINALLDSGYRGLVTDEAAPDRFEYIARFKGALVLAPYERERFAHAVSGVVLDALLHGAPVIATKGTWPGMLVERFGAGVTLEERTSLSLARAIDTVLSEWPKYSANACEASKVLSREHDPVNLLKAIL